MISCTIKISKDGGKEHEFRYPNGT